MYAINGGTSNVTVIDGSTNTVMTSVSLGAQPSDIAINTATNKIYVVCPSGPAGVGEIDVIDGATNSLKQIRQSSVEGPLVEGPFAVAVNKTTNRIYVANGPLASNPLTIIDGSTDTVCPRWPMPRQIL